MTSRRTISVLMLSITLPTTLLIACSSEESTSAPPRAGSSSTDKDGGSAEADDGATSAPSDASATSDGSPDGAPPPEWVGPDGGVSASMNFFVTSRGMGKGGDMRANAGDADGLAGADAFCKTLANDVSPVLGAKSWVAYLSTSTVNARDRIGPGPYTNAKGVVIASGIGQLHDEGSKNLLAFDTNLDEAGNPVPISGPNVHDILTGTNADGSKNANHCSNWTSSDTGVKGRLGHSNRMGGGQDPTSWNSAHDSQGCAESGAGSVRNGGGRGSFYCFVK